MVHSLNPDISSLTALLNWLHPLPPEIVGFLQDKTSYRQVRKGKMLVRSGEVCHHLYFIKKGAIRGFIKDEEKDITTWISIDNEVVTSISGLNDKAPSIENIQAIEHADLMIISHDDLETLYRDYLEFNIVGRKLLQRYYQDAEARAFIARIPGTENKYQHFVKNYPHLINRIPIKYIASFLGVTLETLSRVRKRISG
ncbi:Crp/Fnr family transcriptional regulator [Flavihumibacter sp. UBA7668]|uniref:Crp/Fnr family transcriptional regulator n=1 Tax=Flavihumibacter sp. UBA7668 TaxID=1946542 RepID=UPI0025C1B645|nr:Crp/Fnr family transcriptional regulator [Flavihumibacter sp. UBA7668]